MAKLRIRQNNRWIATAIRFLDPGMDLVSLVLPHSFQKDCRALQAIDSDKRIILGVGDIHILKAMGSSEGQIVTRCSGRDCSDTTLGLSELSTEPSGLSNRLPQFFVASNILTSFGMSGGALMSHADGLVGITARLELGIDRTHFIPMADVFSFLDRGRNFPENNSQKMIYERTTSRYLSGDNGSRDIGQPMEKENSATATKEVSAKKSHATSERGPTIGTTLSNERAWELLLEPQEGVTDIDGSRILAVNEHPVNGFNDYFKARQDCRSNCRLIKVGTQTRIPLEHQKKIFSRIFSSAGAEFTDHGIHGSSISYLHRRPSFFYDLKWTSEFDFQVIIFNPKKVVFVFKRSKAILRSSELQNTGEDFPEAEEFFGELTLAEDFQTTTLVLSSGGRTGTAKCQNSDFSKLRCIGEDSLMDMSFYASEPGQLKVRLMFLDASGGDFATLNYADMRKRP